MLREPVGVDARSDSDTGAPRRSVSARGGPRLQLGPYEIIERLGAGGMAEVWKARKLDEQGHEHVVAIKRLSPELAHERSVAAMFLDEARLAAQLRHPGIVGLEEVGRDPEGAPYMVLEFIDGHDLRWFLATAARARYWLPVELSLSVVRDLLRALTYAHEAVDGDGEPLNVVHRDVSHSNVFVSKAGRVKLADFGIARARGRLSQTRTGMVKGKIGYLSPEQVRAEQLDPRTDVFSAGVVLWELLTQRRMFIGETDFKTMLAVCRDPRRPPSTLRPGLPPQIDALVLRAVEIMRDQRYASATDFADAITDTARALDLNIGPEVTTGVLGYLEEMAATLGLEPSKTPEAQPLTVEVSSPFVALTPRSSIQLPDDEQPSDTFARTTADLTEVPSGEDSDETGDGFSEVFTDGFSDGDPTESGMVPSEEILGIDALASGNNRRAALIAAPLLGLRLEILHDGHTRRAHTFTELFHDLVSLSAQAADEVMIDGQRALSAIELTRLLGLDLARILGPPAPRGAAEWSRASALDVVHAYADAALLGWSGYVLTADTATRMAVFSHGALAAVASRDPAEQLAVVLAAAAPDAHNAPLARLIREVATRRRPISELAAPVLGLAPEAYGGLHTGLEVELLADMVRFEPQSISRREGAPLSVAPTRPALSCLVAATSLGWSDAATEAALAPLGSRRVTITPPAAAVAQMLGFGRMTSPMLEAIRPGLTVDEVRAAAPGTPTAARVLLLLIGLGALHVS